MIRERGIYFEHQLILRGYEGGSSPLAFMKEGIMSEYLWRILSFGTKESFKVSKTYFTSCSSVT